jgi:hypothetical protein
VSRVTGSLALLLAIAIGARLAWNLLSPMVPSIVAALLVVLLAGLVLQRRWR